MHTPSASISSASPAQMSSPKPSVSSNSVSPRASWMASPGSLPNAPKYPATPTPSCPMPNPSSPSPCATSHSSPTKASTTPPVDASPAMPGAMTITRSSNPNSNSSPPGCTNRSEEHTSELQSLTNLVCRLLLDKKNTHTESSSARVP